MHLYKSMPLKCMFWCVHGLTFLAIYEVNKITDGAHFGGYEILFSGVILGMLFSSLLSRKFETLTTLCLKRNITTTYNVFRFFVLVYLIMVALYNLGSLASGYAPDSFRLYVYILLCWLIPLAVYSIGLGLLHGSMRVKRRKYHKVPLNLDGSIRT